MTGAGERPLVVVLGASGPVGSAVTTALSARPVRLRAVARRRPTVPGRAGLVAEVETGAADLTDPDRLADAVRGAAAVINLVKHDGGWRAAEGDPGSERANTGVMAGVLAALREAPAAWPPPVVVFSGTVSQLGVPGSRPMDGSEPDAPVTAYDRQKLAAERLLKEATAAGAVRGVSLRLPTVFGQGPGARSADQGVVSTMARRALAGQELPMWHDGTVLRELIYVSDVAAAVGAALDHSDALAGGHWLLGADRSVPLGQVLSLVARAASAITGRPPVPVVTVTPPQDAPAIDFTSVTVDSSLFRKATGWRPLVPLRTAVERTVAAQAAA
ncbi:NAD-dependent epimerase/dehydratase family protein [Streptomyces profundus]|uniref:NAD-dependent epimerase/dehydratase family protein n=1 Tax=Streptomyces profundus TaxID=2867410 RepID=UPI001D16BD95|nr:NAD-dependent epimerase/dehydratase [Streptomyces sp. MA3_2.13]UED83232.1 NAD-dependent epimerase/dehydratase [Streptomyces sp. MA3_2.13]